ncbi:MAG: alpha/beta hydrolase, partial [Clostridia bacterium]|nr:alpha/beta hydrolase [Clostridia bacterium]
MRYLEYGPAELKPILLFHGGGLSVWNYREAARLLESDFHVVLPFLDGHAGSVYVDLGATEGLLMANEQV